MGSKEGTEGSVLELSGSGVLARKLLPGSRGQACFWRLLLGFWLRPVPFTHSQGAWVGLGNPPEDRPQLCLGLKALPSAVTAIAKTKVLTIIPHTPLTTHHPHGHHGLPQLQFGTTCF